MYRIKLRIFAISVILVLCVASLAAIANADQYAIITLYTDKPTYWLGDTVTAYGYLDVNQTRISNGTVGLQVVNPMNYSILFRTLPTGTSVVYPQTITILSVFLSDSYGHPISSFVKQAPYITYFNVTLRNNNSTSQGFYATVSVFDSAQGLLGSSFIEIPAVLPHGISKSVLVFNVPSGAPIGTAAIYTNIFTKFPRQGGYPLCAENLTTFQIINPGGQPNPTQPPTVTQTNGQFATKFIVPLYGTSGVGNYTVYTSSRYKTRTATAQRTILLKVPDLNGDGKVNILDLLMIASQLGWTGTPGSNPEDLNQDGTVNILDLIICVRFLGWTAP